MITKEQRAASRRLRAGSVIAAWAEHCAGPGWSNSPVWVLLRLPGDGKLVLECLQPLEQTAQMHHLFTVNSAAAASMMNAVVMLKEEGGKRG